MTQTEDALLGGRYRLGESIGTGGMAEVYVGTDVRLGRAVAVKVLRADLAREPAFHQRFRREAQAAASLSAPQIVSVYDTGTDDQVATGPGGRAVTVPWIVMELVEGRTLREVLTDEGRLLPSRALEVVGEVCTALQVAHDAGIVHRDVKPGNVMLSRDGAVKVMDFGIARAASASSRTVTETASVMGTAAYLSPEQARGEHVDARSDVYSTGCLLYELLTGSPPFTGDSAVAVAYQHVREDPVPPSEWDSTLPRGLDAVVLKALAKNPANRYQSAREMAEDLERAAKGRPVLATPLLPASEIPEPAPEPTGREGEVSERTRAIVYAAAGVALVVYIAVLAAALSAFLSTDSGQITAAPSLTGRSQAQALTVLSENGLRVGEIEPVFSNEPVGQVLMQEPRTGIVVDADRRVDLTVSQGPRRSIVPPLVGRSRDEAEALLDEVGLTVDSEVLFRDGFAPEGTVLEVIPGAGTVRATGSSVTLVVASGNVAVPGVVGQSLEQAARAVQLAGFNVAIRYVDDLGPAGVVLSQSPQAQETAGLATDVVLEVSQTPAPVTPTPEPTPTDVVPTDPGLPPGTTFGPP